MTINTKLFLFVTLMMMFFNFNLLAEEPKSEQQTITIGFGGDTMLGRLVNEKIKTTSFFYPWGDMLPLLKKNDLNIINLETTFTHSENAVLKAFNFKSDPEHVSVLNEGNIHVVTLANNHSFDFGIEGFKDTLKTLDNAGIQYVGAGLNIMQAQNPVILTKNGIKIGILGATDNEPSWRAEKNKPGTNYIEIDLNNEFLKKLIDDIKNLKQQVDIVIVSLHWGPNMRQRPTQDFVDVAHKLIDAGVDIIHGHSAHIFQGIENYKNKLIMYDTGDFVDDYIVDPVLHNDRSFLFNITIDKTGIKKLQLIPVLIEAMQVNRAPEHDAQESLKRMQKLSAEFGTEISDDGYIRFHLF